jgi:predicted branched-subunit amino acid permease
MNDNMYAAPKSDVEMPDKERKRPFLVWVIFIIACLGAFGIISHFAMMTGNFPMDGATAKYYESLTVIDHLFVVLGTLYGFVAGLQLFRLKRSAFYLYLGQIPLSLAMFANAYSNPNYQELLASMGASIYYSLLPGFVFLFLYALYAYYLLKKGTLRK